MSKEKNRISPYPLRLAPELRAELEKASKENTRSLHAEILHILTCHFDPEQKLIDAIDNGDSETKAIIKTTMLELLLDLEKEGKIIITKDIKN